MSIGLDLDNYLRGVEKILEIPSFFGDTFQEVLRCVIKKYFFYCYILLEFN